MFVLKSVLSRNIDKMDHLHGEIELRKYGVHCQEGELYRAWDIRSGSAWGRRIPVSARQVADVGKTEAMQPIRSIDCKSSHYRG